MAYCSLGCVFELQGGLPKAVEHYQASINLFNSLKVLLNHKNEWKVYFKIIINWHIRVCAEFS